MKPDRSGFRCIGSYYIYEILWRIVFVILIPFVLIGRLCLLLWKGLWK